MDKLHPSAEVVMSTLCTVANINPVIDSWVRKCFVGNMMRIDRPENRVRAFGA